MPKSTVPTTASTLSESTEFVGVADAAKLLGVSRTTIQRMVDTGLLPSWKTAGGHRRIPKSGLEDISMPGPGFAPREIAVLICDSHDHDRATLASAIDEWRFPLRMICTSDWAEAMVLAARHPPDVWIIDPDFHDVSGWELVLRMCRLTARESTAVVLTSRKRPPASLAEEFRKYGIQVFRKPLPIDQIHGMLGDRVAHMNRRNAFQGA